jgi:hypothetical protein
VRLLLLSAALAPGFVASPAGASPMKLQAAMTAEEVKPIPGPLGAKGTAKIDVDAVTGQVCYQLTYEGPGTMTGAHIHRGEKGITGPVTINLDVNAPCVNPGPSEAKALADWPDGYYVEIHTLAYQSNGAVRGQTSPAQGHSTD